MNPYPYDPTSIALSGIVCDYCRAVTCGYYVYEVFQHNYRFNAGVCTKKACIQSLREALAAADVAAEVASQYGGGEGPKQWK